MGEEASAATRKRLAVEMVARHLAGEKVPALVSVEVAIVDQESLASK